MSDWYSELPRTGESYPVKKKRKRRSAKAWITRESWWSSVSSPSCIGVYTVVNRGHEWLQAKAAETTIDDSGGQREGHNQPRHDGTQIGQLLEDKGVIASPRRSWTWSIRGEARTSSSPARISCRPSRNSIAVVDKLENGPGLQHLQGHHPGRPRGQPDSRLNWPRPERQECRNVSGPKQAAGQVRGAEDRGDQTEGTTLGRSAFPRHLQSDDGGWPDRADRGPTCGLRQEDRVAPMGQGRGAGADSLSDRDRGFACLRRRRCTADG